MGPRLGCRSASGRRGQPGRPSAGLSATELCPPGYQAGVASRLVLERPSAVPDAPGSYQFKDADGRVIYVGKALSLRQRLASYFGDPTQLHPRTQQMLERARSVEWIQVRSEVEAIMLEYSLIKAHRPHFNVRLVDDKSYPYIAATTDETWPRAARHAGHEAQGHALFRPVRPGLRRPGDARHARCGRSRSGPARTRSSPATSGSGGRVSSTTSNAARARASAR